MAQHSTHCNHGATVQDLIAVGDSRISQTTWLEQRQIDSQDRVQLKKLSHMRYQHPDLIEIQKFMADFGMQVAKQTEDEIWLRGYGPDQYVYYARKGPKKFLGGVFEAQNRVEFEKATRLPTAGPVQELSNAPGGGYLVAVIDPDGFPFNVIFDQEAITAEVQHPERIVLNYTGEKARRRKFNRFEPGPAGVHKLGHFGYNTPQFETLLKFYTTSFNFNPTDLLYVEKNGGRRLVTMFAHLDHGETLVDHHSLFMSSNPKDAHVHHCSFEVHDFDTQHLGHQWLAQKGYQSVWGVGRHILGSQIFDYWWDTTGNMVEHYTDGDVVNQDTPIGYRKAGSELLAVWGPEVPEMFLE